eukprot:1088679-Karenia_brevis.AAC.1
MRQAIVCSAMQALEVERLEHGTDCVDFAHGLRRLRSKRVLYICLVPDRDAANPNPVADCLTSGV